MTEGKTREWTRGLDLGTVYYIIQVAEFNFNLGEKCCRLWLIAIELVRLRRLQNATLVLTFVLGAMYK